VTPVDDGPAGRTPRAARGAWLLAALALALAAAAMAHAMSLRSQLETATRAAEAAESQVAGLETGRLGLEQRVNRLQQVVDVVTAPDVRRARLAGRGPAASAGGLAYWSASRGLVFHATSLPPLEAGRGYELWVIPTGRDAEALSLGMLAVSLTGASSHAVQVPDDLDVSAVVVTIEQGSGSPTGQPTSAPVLTGHLSG
jgi:hypothetical protein